MKVTYSKYKSTNISWLPTLPQTWELVKAKFLFTERVQKGFENEPLLAATQTQGVIPKSLYEVTTVTAQKDFHLLKLVEVGDFVISLRSFQGGIEYAYYKGIISPAYTIFFPKNSKRVNNQFYKYFFKSQPFIKSLVLFVTGIREGQNIDFTEFKNSLLPLPSIEEQNSIANYLDSQNAQLNLFISKKQKLIALLKEQRPSIICKAVTKGIDEKAELKNTGLDWLGEIPNHWSTLPFFAAFKEKYIKNDKQQDYDVLSLSYGTIVKRKLDDNFGLLPESFDTYQMTSPGDYIFRLTDMQNDHKSLRVGLSKISGIITSAYLNVRAKIEIDEDFAFYLLHSYDLSKIIYTLGGGVRQSIGFAELKRIPILLPPMQEQKEIVQFIKSETSRIDEAISRIEKEIELIKEYKQSIVAEVVTGKRKVI
jgi:type I restriction enzyme S subunit